MSLPVRDPGLQPERTRLAWRRTTLTWTVVTLLALRQAIGHGTGWAASAALLGVAWFGFGRLAHHRTRALGSAGAPATLSTRTAVAAAGCTLALAATATMLVR